MDGVDAFIQFIRIIVSVSSVFLLIVTVWWATLIIRLFGAYVLGIDACRKKNYQAECEAENSTGVLIIWEKC